jgi:hypothetical protein
LRRWLARPSLDGIIRCGERLRGWASDTRFGTFVGTTFSHAQETRKIADGSNTRRNSVLKPSPCARESCKPYAAAPRREGESLSCIAPRLRVQDNLSVGWLKRREHQEQKLPGALSVCHAPLLYRARFPTIRHWLAWAALALLIFVAYLPAQRGGDSVGICYLRPLPRSLP